MKKDKKSIVLLAIILCLIIALFFVYQNRSTIKYKISSVLKSSSVTNEENKNYREIKSEVEVEDLAFYRARFDATGGKRNWFWIFEGKINNLSSEPTIFTSSKLKLFDAQNNLIFEKDNPILTNQFTKEGYLYEQRIIKQIDEGEGFYKKEDLGANASIERRALTDIPPNSSVDFWFMESFNEKFARAELEINTETYYENSPLYKKKSLEIKYDVASQYSKILRWSNVDPNLHKGYNIEGNVYNGLDTNLENPFVFIRIYFKPTIKNNDKHMIAPLTCGVKIADQINKQETIYFDFKDALIDEVENRCLGPNYIYNNLEFYDIDKIEAYSWAWEK
jgi:hypothetical protein